MSGIHAISCTSQCVVFYLIQSYLEVGLVMTLEFTWKFGVLSNFFNLLQNGNPENSEVVKSKITGKSTTSKSGRLILITSPSQFQILRLPSPMKANKVQLSCVLAAQFFFWFIFSFCFKYFKSYKCRHVFRCFDHYHRLLFYSPLCF